VSRYLAREHEIPESDARKLLRRATSEGLVVVYTSVTSKGDNAGAEQDGYRVPSVEDEEDGEKARVSCCFGTMVIYMYMYIRFMRIFMKIQ
jgi:hypothetical protein